MRLQVDIESGEVKLAEGRLIPVESAKLEPDAEILQAIATARNKAPHLAEVVGQINTMAFRRYYRESNLGNLLSYILKEASGADIAIMNSGSLRADFNPGAVTAEEVLNVYTFIGKFHVVEITDEAVRELLEYSYALHYGYGQMSGVEATYDSRKPIGERLLEANVGGKPLDRTRIYTVSSSAFMANGGDGYSMLAAGKLVHKSPAPLYQSFLDYFETTGKVRVPPIGRQMDLARTP